VTVSAIADTPEGAYPLSALLMRLKKLAEGMPDFLLSPAISAILIKCSKNPPSVEGLEELIGIERELEDGLLLDNYDCLSEQSGKRCAGLVVEYLHKTESVSGKDISFIKRLTKVAHHVMQSSHTLDDLLFKLYSFNMEGVKRLRDGAEADRSENNLISLESHLLAYAGNAAKALFEQRKDISWAEKWYLATKTSADMTRDTDPKHSAHSYGFAGNAAKALFEQRKDISWAEKWYTSYKTSADITRTSEPAHSAHAYSFAGNAAKALFEITADLSWAENWYLATKTSADMTRDTDPKHSAHAYSFAGDTAKAIFEHTQDVSWAEKWYLATNTSADMTRDTDPKHSAHAYSFAGDTAKAIFEHTQDVSWAEKWYLATKTSADMTRDTDPKHSAHAYSFAGNAAKALSRITHNKSWARAAIECYNNLLGYYSSHPNPRMSNLIDRTEGDIHFLQRFI